MRNPFGIRSQMGIKKRLIFLLLIVFVPILLLEVFIFYRWYEDRKEAELQANLELARSTGKNFETFLQGLVRSEVGIGLAQSSARIGIWDWHLDSGRLEWTQELEQIYGYAPGTFPGNYAGFADRVHPDDLAATERLRDEAVKAHQSFDCDFRVRLPSGETRWVNSKGGAIYDDTGNPQRVFGVNVDITERKRAEERIQQQVKELQAVNEELTRFNDAAVGREMRMIELKKEVDDLCKEAGKPPRYLLEFEKGPAA